MDNDYSETAFDGDSDLSSSLNDTDVRKEIECLLKAKFDSDPSASGSILYCPQFWDAVLCWPKTPNGTVAILPCFEELRGIKYDTSRKYIF
ncbi:hypothetical protein L9F63_013842 [Diploptera punctata]|uniref:G-protein coupled receptors family 2 profile 1 domain-containing protein n=1 Tax=Diploptera punctata TaxID=6984 RepID=A0AAD8EM25_DIPPU|nr:hypothetical protein L9F63_013842 [Diploptera punctata]